MALTVVTGFVMRHMGRVTSYVRARAQHEYNELSLNVETKLWQIKNATKDTIPVKVYTDVGKVFSSYKTMRAKEADERRTKKHDRTSIRLRNKKKEQSPYGKHTRKVEEMEAEREHYCDLKDTGIAWGCKAPYQAACHNEDVWLRTQHKATLRIPRVTYTTPELEPTLDYMEEMRALYPTSDDHEERRERTAATLESILGPQRMSASVGLPSGDSGISNDPVLAQYYEEKNIYHTLELWQGYQEYQRRLWEEHQSKVAEQEAERQRKIVLLEHYCSKYDQRVLKLVQFGPKINTEITKLLQAFENGDLESLQHATITLITETLEPANSIFEKMKEEIALEELGAQELMNAWPLNGIDTVLNVFKDETLSVFGDEVQEALRYMLQGLRALCKPVLSAVPLTIAFNEEVTPIFAATPIPIPFYDYAASVNTRLPPQIQPQFIQQQFQAAQQQSQASQQPPQASQQHSRIPQQQPQAPQAVSPEGVNAGKNFASFADLTKAAKVSSSEQSHAPKTTAPLTSSSLPTLGAPTATAKADNISTPKTNKVLVLMKYIEDQVLDFQDNVSKFIKEGKVNTTRRGENETILQWMVDYVADDTGILTDNEGYLMKTEIKKMINKIANLSSAKEKNVQKTRIINVLAHQALKIWA